MTRTVRGFNLPEFDPPLCCKYGACINKAVVKGYCRKHWFGHARGKRGAAGLREARKGRGVK